MIDALITMTSETGEQVREHYRLATTLLDAHQDPAERLVSLYQERWEVESAYYALRCTLQEGLVLWSQDRPGVEQEMWGQLIVYQLLRSAMVNAVETRAGLDPDRASSIIALEAARDSVLLAHTPASHASTNNLLGAVGRAVLAGLLPCVGSAPAHDRSKPAGHAIPPGPPNPGPARAAPSPTWL